MTAPSMMDMEKYLQDLRSTDSSIRYNAVKALAKGGYTSTIVFQALQAASVNEKNKYIKEAVKKAIGKLQAIREVIGPERSVVELPDRELLEHLFLYQVEQSKAYAALNRFVPLLMWWLLILSISLLLMN